MVPVFLEMISLVLTYTLLFNMAFFRAKAGQRRGKGGEKAGQKAGFRVMLKYFEMKKAFRYYIKQMIYYWTDARQHGIYLLTGNERYINLCNKLDSFRFIRFFFHSFFIWFSYFFICFNSFIHSVFRSLVTFVHWFNFFQRFEETSVRMISPYSLFSNSP